MPTQNKGQLLQREVQYFMKPTNQNNQNVSQGHKNNIGLQKKTSNQMTVQEENKNTAFRKLFEEEEDPILAETSPQFKKI